MSYAARHAAPQIRRSYAALRSAAVLVLGMFLTAAGILMVVMPR